MIMSSTKSLEGKVSDPNQIYFSDIRDYPLLSKKEEVELVRRLRRGTSYETQGTNGTRKKIEILTEDAREARESLVLGNLRLVVKLAKKYYNWGAQYNLSLGDLIQYGNTGLLNAPRAYKLNRGFRFATYAGRAARNAIIGGVRSVQMRSRGQITSNEDNDFLKYAPDTKSVLPENSPGILEEEKRREVEKIFKMIGNERSRSIIYMKYFLKCTLGEIGKACNLSKERVRQIEETTMTNLRKRLGVKV